ncbi:MAG: hypothetical protein ABI693_12120 [Bryobacteraceae bacterium]
MADNTYTTEAMFLFDASPTEGHPSLHSILNLLDEGEKDDLLTTHLCECAGCRATLDRHRRLVELDEVINQHGVHDES